MGAGISDDFSKSVKKELSGFLEAYGFQLIAEQASETRTSIVWGNVEYLILIYGDPRNGEVNCQLKKNNFEHLDFSTAAGWRYIRELRLQSLTDLEETAIESIHDSTRKSFTDQIKETTFILKNDFKQIIKGLERDSFF